MLQSIIVYTLTGLTLYALGRNLALRDARMQRTFHHPTSSWNPEVWLSILIFAIVAGLRYNVGVDHLTYLRFYEEFSKQGWTTRETFEPGFLFIMKVFTELNLHFFFFFAFLAAIQLFFIYFALRKQKQLLPYIGLFIMLGPYFLDWMNGIRQCIAMCIFVLSIEFIQKRKFILYILTIFGASLIHKSAYILLPFYFIFFKSFSPSKTKTHLLILILCIILGNSPTWISFITVLNDFFTFLGYENYVNNFENVLDNLQEFAWGPRRITVLLINFIIIYLYPQISQFYHNNKYVPLYFSLFFIGVCLYNLLANTSLEFLRPVSYFTIFTLPMSAYTAHYLKIKKRKMFYLLFMILVCSYTYFSIFSTNGPDNIIWYKFFFDY